MSLACLQQQEVIRLTVTSRDTKLLLLQTIQSGISCEIQSGSKGEESNFWLDTHEEPARGPVSPKD